MYIPRPTTSGFTLCYSPSTYMCIYRLCPKDTTSPYSRPITSGSTFVYRSNTYSVRHDSKIRNLQRCIKLGIGCVLMESGKVNASRKLKPHELNYPTLYLELVDIVHALKIWRYYLYGGKSENLTNYKSLKYVFTQKQLNMRKRRRLELIKNYDCKINYHPSKANVDADALSRMGRLCFTLTKEKRLVEEFDKLKIEIVTLPSRMTTLLPAMTIQPTLRDLTKQTQMTDYFLLKMRSKVEKVEDRGFQVSADGVLYFEGHVCVLNDESLKDEIFKEHYTSYTAHPGGMKMYRKLQQMFWWRAMKNDSKVHS